MKKTKNLLLIVVAFMMVACSYDNESDLVEALDQEESISYEANISSIMSSNCLGCHSNPPQNGAPFSLTTYDAVVSRAQNGQLLNVISKQTGEPNAMPPSGRMAQSTIDIVAQWIEEGLLEE